jgi:hypothetical protein
MCACHGGDVRVCAVSGFIGGGAVLPQNFQQPIAAPLTQPVLSSQQAMQLIPNDQLQVTQANSAVHTTSQGAAVTRYQLVKQQLRWTRHVTS